MGVGGSWLLPRMQGLQGVTAHSKLDSRIDISYQALPLANKGHRGWVKALAEH